MSSSDFKIDGSSPTVTWADPKNTDSSSSTQVRVNKSQCSFDKCFFIDFSSSLQ